MTHPKHEPAPDASADVWVPYLRGLGYIASSEAKPFANYYELHGYWVPPRIGPGPARPAPALKRTARPRAPQHGVDPAWFDFDNLLLLRRHHPEVFQALPSRIVDAERAQLPTDPREELLELRDRLASSREAGLIGPDAAAQQLAERARELGIDLAD